MENACNCNLGCFSSAYLNSDFPRSFSERHRVENSVTPGGDSGRLFSLSVSANSGIQGSGANREDAPPTAAASDLLVFFPTVRWNCGGTDHRREPTGRARRPDLSLICRLIPVSDAEVTADHAHNAGRWSPDASCDETQTLWASDDRKKHKTVVFQRSVRLL